MRSRYLLAAGAACVLLAGCGTSAGTGTTTGSTAGAVRVVAAENFWGDIAKQIGGAYVNVTSIISDPTTDPHTFETDPRTAAAITRAQLVVENGLGYDDFIGKVLSTSHSASRRIVSVQDVLSITAADANPHVWYDTARLPAVAAAIAAQLSSIDPAHATEFRNGANEFDASLQPLLAVVAQIKAKYAGTPIAYTERVPGYLVDAAGLRLATPASFARSLENGNDPSPQDTAAFTSDIRDHKVKVLMYNAQVVDAQTTQIKQLAQESGVPVVGVTETLPPTDKNFQAWQLRQMRELLAALGG